MAVCVLVGDVYYASVKVSDSSRASAVRLEQLDVAQEMRVALLQMTLAAMDAIVDKAEGDIAPQRMQAMAEAATFLTRNMAVLEEVADTPEERRAVAELRGQLPALIQGVTVELPALIRKHGGSTDAAAEADFERMDDVVDDHAEATMQQIDFIALSIRDELSQAAAELERDVAASAATALWVGGGVLLTAGLFFTLIARGILRPLRGTLEFAQAVARGELQRELLVRTRDEAGDLADALRTMVGSLKDSLAQARQQGEDARRAAQAATEAMAQAEQARREAEQAKAQGMLQAAARLEEVVGIISSASEELAAQVEESSQGAAQQSTRITEAATAMEEMNATVLEVARSASQAADTADAARRKAVEGAEVVQRVVTGVTEVSDHSQRLKADMADLGEKAKGIGQVLNVISDIADQTNLLALNAAIEAARAGDAGRGFAVVADEVRKLAEKTMQATREVDAAIRGIQQGAATNILNVEQAAATIASATAQADESGRALKAIVTLVDQATDQVRSIATASEEQSAASEEIARNIEAVQRLSVEASDSMQQSAQAVRELAAQGQRLRMLVGELTADGSRG
ncbi:MAG: methyl-accepting chemotaxis protein [Desulfovibrio sp.]|nr:methyl-accepting chemotaxis protein [Desulfovibrio sp.]